MRLHLEPTSEIATVDGAPHRVWKGRTGRGTEVIAWVRAVQPQTHDEDKLVEFERELQALPSPRCSPVAIDWRLVL